MRRAAGHLSKSLIHTAENPNKYSEGEVLVIVTSTLTTMYMYHYFCCQNFEKIFQRVKGREYYPLRPHSLDPPLHIHSMSVYRVLHTRLDSVSDALFTDN